MTTSTLGRLALVLAGAAMAVALAQAQQASDSSKASAPATTATAQSAQKPAAGAKSDGAPPVKTAAAAQKPADSQAQLIRDARAAGFKPETIKGSQMFCRTAVELGSNFPVRTCYDSDQVKIKIQEYTEQRNQMEQMHSSGLMTH